MKRFSYNEYNQFEQNIKNAIVEIEGYDEVDHYITAHFQQFLTQGEYDDNSIELANHYNTLKIIQADPDFFHKLYFVLNYLQP
jgi:hypothetical protein